MSTSPNDYINWSGLKHIKELVSLDGMLNDLIFNPNFETEEEYQYFEFSNESIVSNFFNSKEYVLDKVKEKSYFNFLAIIKESKRKESRLIGKEFQFIGYDLIEKNGHISALTNCGGFNETFRPEDLNEYGLINEITNAKEIQKQLFANNPEEIHADCFLYEVWRHQRIGRN